MAMLKTLLVAQTPGIMNATHHVMCAGGCIKQLLQMMLA
jgi:hypothetical protein